MSQSPAKYVSISKANNYATAWDQILEWTKEGRSWSGRERNCCFINTRDGKFADVSAAVGMDFIDDSRGLATSDWDHDGDLDFWITGRTSPRVRLIRNDYAAPGHFLSLRLRSNTGNRDAIGARVTVITKESSTGRVSKTLRAGDGYLSQQSKRLHFGLGDNVEPVDVEIRWSDGTEQIVSGLQPDLHYVITQGVEVAELWKRDEPVIDVVPTTPPQIRSDASIEILLASRHELPQVEYLNAQRESTVLNISAQRPRLVVQWSASCRPCIVELRELSENADRINNAGLDVLALSVDGIRSNSKPENGLGTTLQGIAFPFKSGMATIELLEALQAANDRLFSVRRPLRLPSSFLFDPAGKLAAIYKGPFDLDRVLKDVESLSLKGDALLSAAVPRDGQWLSAPRGLRMSAHIGLGVQHARDGRWEEALKEFELAREETPDGVEVYLQLGRALDALGRSEEAIASLNEAIMLAPALVDAQVMLGDIYMRQRESHRALKHLLKAAAQAPRDGALYTKIGVLYAGLGDIKLAIQNFEAAAELSPQAANIHSNLGKAYLDAKRYAEATIALEAALSLPNPPLAAKLNLAIILASAPDAKLREGRRAVTLAAECAKVLNGRNPTALGHLAAALAEAGEFERAKTFNNRALELARKKNDERLVSELSARGRLYEAGRPYRLSIE